MAPTPNARLLFKSVPQGYPVVGETMETDSKSTIDLDAPLAGGVLVKLLTLSVDPYMRGRMRGPEGKSYTPPYTIGEPLNTYGVGVVLRSEHADIKQGDHLYGFFNFQEYQLVPAPWVSQLKVLPKDSGVPWSVYVGVAGMPGKTAYYGWKEIAAAKKGETVYVSTGAGPVGSMVIQLAKADGLKVIASTGSAEKLEFLKKLGADVAFNYKEEKLADVLEKHGPVDIYWDHVGGESLETTITHMNTFGRIIIIGAISQYNSAPHPVGNLIQVLAKRLLVRGMLVGDHEAKYGAEFYQDIPARIARGEIQYTETTVHSIDAAQQLIVDVQKGVNQGKAVVVLHDQ